MKKLMALILCFMMVLSITACSSPEETAKSTEGTATEATATEAVATATAATDSADPVKIVLLVSGTLGDKSFHDSAQAGMDMIKSKYGDGVEVKTIEMGSDKTKFVPTLEDVSEEDWDLIISGTFHMKEPLEQVAPLYPEKNYILFDTAVDYEGIEGLDNVYSITYKQNEAGYLAGVLAAQMTTRTDIADINPEKVIGFLGAQDVPVINDFLVGYIEGAKAVDPEMKVDISYIDSFSDAAKGKELALIQYQSKGVDVGFNVAGRAGLGQVEAALETNGYAIGVDSDQAALFVETSPEKADRIVSSALKRVDISLLRAVDMYMEGKLPVGTVELLGVKEGAVGLAKNEYYEKLVPDDIKANIIETEGKIASGEIVVGSAIGMDAAELTAIKDSVK